MAFDSILNFRVLTSGTQNEIFGIEAPAFSENLLVNNSRFECCSISCSSTSLLAFSMISAWRC